jgi:hypothetical protein
MSSGRGKGRGRGKGVNAPRVNQNRATRTSSKSTNRSERTAAKPTVEQDPPGEDTSDDGPTARLVTPEVLAAVTELRLGYVRIDLRECVEPQWVWGLHNPRDVSKTSVSRLKENVINVGVLEGNSRIAIPVALDPKWLPEGQVYAPSLESTLVRDVPAAQVLLDAIPKGGAQPFNGNVSGLPAALDLILYKLTLAVQHRRHMVDGIRADALKEITHLEARMKKLIASAAVDEEEEFEQSEFLPSGDEGSPVEKAGAERQTAQPGAPNDVSLESQLAEMEAEIEIRKRRIEMVDSWPFEIYDLGRRC